MAAEAFLWLVYPWEYELPWNGSIPPTDASVCGRLLCVTGAQVTTESRGEDADAWAERRQEARQGDCCGLNTPQL